MRGMAAAAFRGVRRDIALVLSGERKRTLYETAKALGRRSGDVQRSMRQMLEEGLLRADSPEPTQGTQYWLSEAGRAALMEEVAAGVVPGLLAERQRLLVIAANDSERFYRLLGQKDLTGIVVWASELGGDGEWLVALDPRTDTVQAGRLLVALTKAGFAHRTLRVESVLDAAQLRQLSIAGADVAERS